jgi:hypothetical protein
MWHPSCREEMLERLNSAYGLLIYEHLRSPRLGGWGAPPMENLR